MKITQDYYLIVDLEATCANDRAISRRQMEIIEIGAVMLNAKTLEIGSESLYYLSLLTYYLKN